MERSYRRYFFPGFPCSKHAVRISLISLAHIINSAGGFHFPLKPARQRLYIQYACKNTWSLPGIREHITCYRPQSTCFQNPSFPGYSHAGYPSDCTYVAVNNVVIFSSLAMEINIYKLICCIPQPWKYRPWWSGTRPFRKKLLRGSQDILLMKAD